MAPGIPFSTLWNGEAVTPARMACVAVCPVGMIKRNSSFTSENIYFDDYICYNVRKGGVSL